jgi:hypothetical protein
MPGLLCSLLPYTLKPLHTAYLVAVKCQMQNVHSSNVRTYFEVTEAKLLDNQKIILNYNTFH